MNEPKNPPQPEKKWREVNEALEPHKDQIERVVKSHQEQLSKSILGNSSFRSLIAVGYSLAMERIAELEAQLSEKGETKKTEQGDYQNRVGEWMNACFPPEVIADVTERNFRFLEESLELVQSLGATKEQAVQLVDYVYSRPIGESEQEVGGVMVTLAALCNASKITMDNCAEDELKRVWTKIDKIRAKHFAKPKEVISSLPGQTCTCADIWGSPDPDCPVHAIKGRTVSEQQ